MNKEERVEIGWNVPDPNSMRQRIQIGQHHLLTDEQKVEYDRVRGGKQVSTHDWSDECWEEMRQDYDWQERANDISLVARGYQLADIVEEGSPKINLVEELTQVVGITVGVQKSTQGWLELDQGSSSMGGGIGTRGGVHSVWSDIGPTMGFVYGVGHGTGTGTSGRSALEDRTAYRAGHLDAQGSIVS